MTIKEIIDKLKDFPEDYEVEIQYSCCGCCCGYAGPCYCGGGADIIAAYMGTRPPVESKVKFKRKPGKVVFVL